MAIVLCSDRKICIFEQNIHFMSKVSVIFLEIESNYTQVDPARELRTAGTVQPGYSPGTEQELS